MDERELIAGPHSEVLQTVQEAKLELERHLSAFLSGVEHVETLLEKARGVARSWNYGPDSKTLMLPDSVRLSATSAEVRASLRDLNITSGSAYPPGHAREYFAKPVEDTELSPRAGARVKLRSSVHYKELKPGAELTVPVLDADHIVKIGAGDFVQEQPSV
jgi:hypothetical protein